MKIVPSSFGKIGTCMIGPKFFLHENIRLGEAALCMTKDAKDGKSLWLIGGIDTMVDYVSLIKSEGEIDGNLASELLSILDNAKKSVPNSAIERLAFALGVDVEAVYEAMKIAQVCISAPVVGLHDYSEGSPRLIEKTKRHIEHISSH